MVVGSIGDVVNWVSSYCMLPKQVVLYWLFNLKFGKWCKAFSGTSSCIGGSAYSCIHLCDAIRTRWCSILTHVI